MGLMEWLPRLAAACHASARAFSSLPLINAINWSIISNFSKDEHFVGSTPKRQTKSRLGQEIFYVVH
jgi:hypothetical protein